MKVPPPELNPPVLAGPSPVGRSIQAEGLGTYPVGADSMPAMLIDWDSVHPGDPLEDVGYAGWTWCIQTEGQVPIVDQAARLRRFRDGYDAELDGRALLAAIEAQQRAVIAVESALLGDGATNEARSMHAAAAIAWARADDALLRANLDVFASALR